MDYPHYTTEDFVFDDRFRQWVLHQKEAEFWDGFIRQYPDKMDAIQQAKKIVLVLEKEKESLPSKEKEILLQNIHQQIKTEKIPVKQMHRRTWLSVAASISAVLLISMLSFLWLTRDEILTYSTAYGEVAHIVLPDGSKVTLNANSELTWISDAEDRVVNLTGEAFFDIEKKSNKQKFIVHSGELMVEVLGTSFNVKQRHELTQVVLTSGKVALHHQSSGVKTIMEPGDLVSLSDERTSFQHQQVNTELYTSWTDRKLLINNTTLGEIAATIEDTYGLEVSISGKALEERKFTSTTSIPLDNPETLLRLIEITLGVEVIQEGQQILIKEQKKNRQ